MKQFPKVFKRSIALVLALLTVLSAANLGAVAQVFATEPEASGTTTLVELIVGNYDGKLNEQEQAIISSGYLNGDWEYSYHAPTAEDNLITVDEENHQVTAKPYTDEYGKPWIPVSAVLTAADEQGEPVTLTEEGDVYVGTYVYGGNMFSVTVTYELWIDVAAEDQNVLLNAPYKLAQDIEILKNLREVSVVGVADAGKETDDTTRLDTRLKALLGDRFDLDTLYADFLVNMVLVTKLEQFGTAEEPKSVIDLIYDLANGMEIYEGGSYLDGAVVVDPITLKMNRTYGKAHATRLKTQQDNGGLELAKVLTANASKSYLELLLVDGLDAALKTNYDDIKYLATNDNTLPHVITELAAYYDLLMGNEENEIKGYYQQAQAFRAEKLLELNNAVAELNAQVSAINPDYAYTGGEIETADDVRALQAYVADLQGKVATAETNAADGLKQANELLKQINEGIAAIDGTIDPYEEQASALLNKTVVIDSYEDYTQLLDDAKTAYNTILGEITTKINAKLSESLGFGNMTYGSVLGMTSVNTLEDLKTFIEKAEANSTVASQFGEQLEVAKTARDTLVALDATITEMEANKETAETAFETRATLVDAKAKAEAGIADATTLQGQLATAKTELERAAQLLEGAPEALEQADAAIAKIEATANELEKQQESLQLLIDLLVAFCDTVEPVYDAFADDSWNTPGLVNSTADYKKLNDWANGLSAYTGGIVNSLYETETDVQFNMSMYNVTVKYEGVKMAGLPDKDDTVALTHDGEYKVTLRKDATKAEIQEKIAELYTDGIIDEAAILAAWEIDDEHYKRTPSTLPETLTGNIEYTVSYAPMNYTVTYDDSFAAGERTDFPYGYVMTLPAYDNGGATEGLKEYVYTVGEKSNIDQGTKVIIEGDVAISRAVGAASAKKYVTDLVIQTGLVTDETSIAILQNAALNKGNSISIRVPGKPDVTVGRLVANGPVRITAKNVGSRVGDKLWLAVNGSYDGTGFTFSNEGDNSRYYETEAGFAQVSVWYELELTAADLNLTDAELLAVMNAPYVLHTDYVAQEARLNALYAQRGNLARLNNNPEDAIMFNGQAYTVYALLGAIKGLNAALTMGIGEDAVNAAEDLAAMIHAGGGQIPLIALLEQYGGSNMAHYYENEAAYLTEIGKLKDILDAMLGDQKLNDLLVANAGEVIDLTAIQNNMNYAADLKAHPVRTDLINVHDTANLPALLNSIKNATGAAYFSTAPAAMTWRETVSQNGIGFHTVTFNVDIAGVTATKLWERIPNSTVLTAAELEEFVYAMFNEKIPAAERKHYVTDFTFVDLTVLTDIDNYNVTWTLKEYPVYVDGNKIDTLTLRDQKIDLPAHDIEGFKYIYTIDGTKYDESVGSYTLTAGQLDKLLNGGGSITITREVIDLVDQENERRENALIAFVDGMKNAATLTKDANGEYAIVLRIDPADLQGGMTNFAMGLAMGTMMGEYQKGITLDGNTFYGDGKFYLQTLIDTIMVSGLGTGTFTTVIKEDGTVNHMTAPGTVIGTNNFGTALGGQLLKSEMVLKNEAYDMPVDFYITLAGGSDQLLNLRNQVAAIEQYVTLVCDDGMAKVTVDLPETVYEAYLAALMMVGEIDIHNFNEVNGYIVMSYLLDLLDPVLNTQSGVTMDTFENTLAKFGMVRELSSYQNIYNQFVTYYEGKTVDENGVCTVPFNAISIKSLIDQLQETVSGSLPEQLKDLKLSGMIAEYENGLNLTLAAEVADANNKYAAIFADSDGDGITNKIGLLTKEELAGKTGGATVIVLLDNYTGDLNFNGTCLLDLNGKTLGGNITAGGKLIVLDSNYQGTPGTVTGTVTGASAIVLGGKFEKPVTANLKPGYVQDENGVVSNELYTITKTDDETVITLNATVEDVKDLASKTGVTALAVELLMDVAINHYNTAGLTVAEKLLYGVSLEDLIGLYGGANRRDALVDSALTWFSASDLGELVDILVADLTNFTGLKTALEGDGKVASYDTTTAPWQVKLEHVTEGDYLTVNVGASETKKNGKLSLVIEGDLTGQMAELAGALADTTTVTSDVELNDIVRNDSNELVVGGTYNGSVLVDFTSPKYAIMMAVILADGSDADLKAKLVAAIESYYDETPVLQDLEAVFDQLTVNQVCTALKKVSRTVSFTVIVNRIGLKDETVAKILTAIDDTELGFNPVIELMSIVLRRLDITGGTSQLGGLKKTDDAGKHYYGFNWDREFTGNRSLVASYKLNYNIDIESVDVKVYLFTDHVHVLHKVDEVPATCTATGTEEHWKCDECGKLFEDELGTLEVSADDLVIAAHIRTAVAEIPATCTAAGTKAHYKCSCDKLYWDEAATDPVEKAEDLVIAAHTRTAVAEIPATCAATGTKAHYKCNECGKLYWDEAATEPVERAADLVISKLPHTEEVIPGKAATCTETGLTEGKKCSVCGEILVTQNVIPVLPHTEGVIHGKAATCTETGLTDGKKCSVCGKILVEQEVIAALGHTEKVVPGKAATCTETGLTEGKKCSVCGEILVEQEVIAALGHDYKATAVWSADASSCKVTETCGRNCGYTKTVDATVTSRVIKPATDEEAGEILYTAAATIDGRTYTFTKSVTLDKVANPTHDDKIAAVKVDVVNGEKYLFKDLDPVESMTLDQLAESLIFEDLAGYTLTMSIAGNDGTGLVKTADKLVVTATNANGEVVAIVGYTLVVLGDVNCDGKVLSNDAIAMMGIYFGSVNASAEQKLAADMNQDKAIGAADAQRTMRKYFTWDKTVGGYVSALQ